MGFGSRAINHHSSAARGKRLNYHDEISSGWEQPKHVRGHGAREEGKGCKDEVWLTEQDTQSKGLRPRDDAGLKMWV